MTTAGTFRLDGPYENVFLNFGTRGDRSSRTRPMPPALLSFQELEYLYSGDGFAARLIDLPADEMTRAGFDIEGIEDGEKIEAALEDIDALKHLALALRWANLYGGALIVALLDDGGLLEEPLVPERIRSIDQLRVYDRWQVTRWRKYTDPTDRRFANTEIYHVSPLNGIPYMVHESRCIMIDGAPLPDRLREQNEGWGLSRLQRCYDQLTRMNAAHMWSNALLERAQQGVHGIPNLTGTLRSPGGEEMVRKRVDLADRARSISNTLVIDAEETYELKSTPLSGVSDLVDRMGLALSAVSGIPESLLFGRQQGGLNSTGKSELENWYASIGQSQHTVLLPALDCLVRWELYAAGRYTEDYLIKFAPLSVPSEKEQAETEYTVAKTHEIYSNIQALDPSEIRSTLGHMVDGLDLSKMPEMRDEPAEDEPVDESANAEAR